MFDDRSDLPILSYEPAAKPDPLRFLNKMRMWRSITAWSSVITILGLVSYFPFALMSVAVLGVASIMALMYMTRAAWHAVDSGYAIRHLGLAIFLMPLALLGVFLVTRLVESDIKKWQVEDEADV
jgi:hypothetical protein